MDFDDVDDFDEEEDEYDSVRRWKIQELFLFLYPLIFDCII